MGLSSNSIIHFTKEKEFLIGILQNNFKIHYCLEKLFIGDGSLEFAVPMVSFCDIPLSEVKIHLENYGPYGIGLTKEWAARQKLNPVLYIEKDSYLSASYYSAYDSYIETQNKNISEMAAHEKSMADILRYMKNYQGNLTRNRKNTIPDYRFSDEREWRYVIDFNEETEMFLSPDEYTTPEQKAQENDLIKDFRLEFTPNDIKYIIIEKEDEIIDFLNILRGAKGDKFSHNEVERLTTRIITTEQLMTDF